MQISHTDRNISARKESTMDNQYEQLQETLSDYRILMKETEDQLQGIMEDLAKDRLVRKIRVEDIKEVLTRLGSAGDKIWVSYGKLYGREAPETITQAEKELSDQLNKLRVQAEVIERFLSLKTNDEIANPPLLKEQNALVADPGQDITKHRYFMSAMDVTCRRPSEYGIDMVRLIQSFDPVLIGALWEGKIQEDKKGIRKKYEQLFASLDVPDGMIAQEDPTVPTVILEDKTEESKGRKKIKKTETDDMQMTLDLVVAETEGPEPAAIIAGTQKIPRSSSQEKLDVTLKDRIRHDLNAVSDGTINVQQEMELIRDLLKGLNAEAPKDADYPKYQPKRCNVCNPTKIKQGAQVVMSLTNGNLRTYQAAFRMMGSMTVKLATYVTGDAEDRAQGSLQRLYNTGVIVRNTPDGDGPIYYNFDTDKHAALRDGWGDNPMGDLGFGDGSYPMLFQMSRNGVRGIEEKASRIYACAVKCQFLEEFYETYHIPPKAGAITDEEDSLISVYEIPDAFFIMHRHENKNFLLLYLNETSVNVFRCIRRQILNLALRTKELSYYVLFASVSDDVAVNAKKAFMRMLHEYEIKLDSRTITVPAADVKTAADKLLDACVWDINKMDNQSGHSVNEKEAIIPVPEENSIVPDQIAKASLSSAEPEKAAEIVEPEVPDTEPDKTAEPQQRQSEVVTSTSAMLRRLLPDGTKATQRLVGNAAESKTDKPKSNKQKPVEVQESKDAKQKKEKKIVRKTAEPKKKTVQTITAEIESQTADADEEMIAGRLAKEREEKINRFMTACLPSKACALFPYLRTIGAENSALYRMASYATDEPGMHHTYSSVGITEAFAEGAEDRNTQLLYLASAMRVICGDSGQTDHGIRGIYDIARGYSDSADSPVFNSLLYEMTEFKKTEPHGAWFFSDIAAGNTRREDAVKECGNNAARYYNEYIENYVPADKRNPRFLFLGQVLFTKKSDLSTLMEFAKNDDRANVELVADELATTFIKDGAPVDAGNIDHNKLNAYIDLGWKKAGDLMQTAMVSSKLYGVYRSNISKKIEKIIDSVAAWVAAVRMTAGGMNNRSVENYKQHSKNWLKLAKDAKKEVMSTENQNGIAVGLSAVAGVLDDCIAYFRGEGQVPALARKYYYIQLLSDGDMILNDNLLPYVHRRSRTLSAFDPAQKLLQYASENMRRSAEDRLSEILTSREEKNHDYASAMQICDFLTECAGKSMSETKEEILAANSTGNIDYALNSFREDLELAQGYGMLDNMDGRKEQILADVEETYKICDASGNYGYFFRMVDAYRKQIVEDSKDRKAAVEEMYRKVTAPDSGYEVSDKMKVKIEQMINRNNYTVAEDLIGRVQSGDISDAFAESSMENDYLDDFIRTFSNWYRMGNIQAQAKTPELAANWIKEKNGVAGEARITAILESMGFKPASVVKLKDKQNDTYEIRLKAPKTRKKDAYQHPISAFGSEAERTSFHVVCLYGKYTVTELKNTICTNGLTKNTIVFMTHKFPMPDRRVLAHRMHTEMQGKTVLVVDQPLMMYLATNCKTSMMPQALMQIAVPYASYQPYIPSSNSDIRTEMFNGRKKELFEIESPTGANIIYGGRQLGKSAILKMAARELDRDENGDRALLVDIRFNNVTEAAKNVSRTLIANGILEPYQETDNWDDLTYALRVKLASENAPAYLLLMMDEADAFIADCKNYGYAPIARLKALQEMPGHRFKFVVAGLRDVIRFTKGAAAGNNSVLPQLRAITVKPFEYNEAKSLIEEPLWYLGFRFDEKTEPLVNTILANTNYFPGLIQLYCEKLVDALAKSDYAGYDRGMTPPYVLSERHIKKVLADEDFQKEVREKYFITLRHADDNYYHILAYLMAYLYMKNGTDGYSPAELWKLACELDIRKIADRDIGEVRALMEEMCELNVFRKAVGDAERYIFSRYNFYQMLGDSIDEIENKLMECMES